MGILDARVHFDRVGCACLCALLLWADVAKMESFGENVLNYSQVICETQDAEGKLYEKKQEAINLSGIMI